VPALIPGLSLVLASQSPRRKELLSLAGFNFTIQPASILEVPLPNESPSAYVARLATEKAYALNPSPNQIILAADTTVALENGQLLEKPANPAEAFEMLTALSARPHNVYTAICLLHDGHHTTHVEHTSVWFAPMTEPEIRAYIATGEPFDKAGGYGIQGQASKFIPRIEGCYFNVMGLPIHQVYRLFHDRGLLAMDEIPSPAS
jgi:septum formation protein